MVPLCVHLAPGGVSISFLISPKVKNAPSSALSSLCLYSISVAAEWNSVHRFPKWKYLSDYLREQSPVLEPNDTVLGVLDTEAAMEAVTSKAKLIPGSLRSLESTFNAVYYDLAGTQSFV